MGDSTNFVVVFAGQLLQEAEFLLRMGLHAAEVIEGYRFALKKSLEIIEGLSIGSVLDFKAEREIKEVWGT